MDGLSVYVARRRGGARGAKRRPFGAIVLNLLASQSCPGPVGVGGHLPREDMVGPSLDPAPIGPVLPIPAKGIRVAQSLTALDVIVLLSMGKQAYVQETHELHIEQAAQDRHGAMLYPLACNDMRVTALLVAIALPPPAVVGIGVLPHSALHVVRAHRTASLSSVEWRGRCLKPHTVARPTVSVISQH